MRRVPVKKRPDALRLVQSQGLVYADAVGPHGSETYWPDNRYYSFTLEEIELLERAAKDVFDMCCETADYLVDRPDVMEKMAIPAFAFKQIIESWNREPAWGSVYGRFDVCFGGLQHPDPRLRTPKFYEFNADTPTSLLESACIQWLWLEQTGCGNDQFNSINESLVEAWKRNLTLIDEKLGHKSTVYFATCDSDSTGEDAMNAMVLMETCQIAGWETRAISMGEIGISLEDGRFYDTKGNHLDVVFKLYPWEFMVEDAPGKACFTDMDSSDGTIWIEAPYKMLWSNKALFAVLWSLFKDDERSRWLLPTYFEGDDVPASLTKYARKPIFSREGGGITLEEDGRVIQDSADESYGKEGHVVQELALPPEFKDPGGRSHYPVLGIWMVDGEPAGMGIREAATPITTNVSAFVPHSIEDGPVNYERRDVPTKEEIDRALSVDQLCDPEREALAQSEMVRFIERITM
ncbi:glutathionylspermidine synthase [Colletotrichum higginsianum IMI 349063]|uniref:Glutathionylspermidine synthase n=2 Tax=Colletotrichum higginsianum TaxID=80884 RepID=A0A1B7YES8_COLHI|nr:glutathionylspermidine synthase [Colletotrichum higginsianum IMI 349063]OBR10404.1 glutathionylspermidine synthase [Colletotrichum higginsianum IMI 349063]TID07506.1 putative acid--amine ligase YgiC [Colletotrichum higginsianum]